MLDSESNLVHVLTAKEEHAYQVIDSHEKLSKKIDDLITAAQTLEDLTYRLHSIDSSIVDLTDSVNKQLVYIDKLLRFFNTIYKVPKRFREE